MVRKMKKKTNSGGGNDSRIIQQAQMMQQEMLKVQEELKEKFVETTVGGEAVKIKANGQKEIVELNISIDLLKDAIEDNDPSMVSDMILSAISEVMKEAEELAEKEMESVTGGISIPGLF